MTQIGKMTQGQLIDVRDATKSKLDALKARKPNKNADVNAGFEKVKAAMQDEIDELDAEIARRA